MCAGVVSATRFNFSQFTLFTGKLSTADIQSNTSDKKIKLTACDIENKMMINKVTHSHPLDTKHEFEPF